MTDPQSAASEQRLSSTVDGGSAGAGGQQPHQFQPIYTLLTNTSTKTTHHPQVQYIFSDDDPDMLTQALAQQHDSNLGESASGPAPERRAILLDLVPDRDGKFDVSWASSLSPSWAVLDAEVSRISPPSSDGGGNGDNGISQTKNKPDRLMLRIEGLEGGSLASEGELRLSGDRAGQGSGSGSGSGSAHRGPDEDYNLLVDEFEKRMTMLRKVVDAGEERRRKLSDEPEVAPRAQEDADIAALPTNTEDMHGSVESG